MCGRPDSFPSASPRLGVGPHIATSADHQEWSSRSRLCIRPEAATVRARCEGSSDDAFEDDRVSAPPIWTRDPASAEIARTSDDREPSGSGVGRPRPLRTPWQDDLLRWLHARCDRQDFGV
jgi:hypothetical protein